MVNIENSQQGLLEGRFGNGNSYWTMKNAYLNYKNLNSSNVILFCTLAIVLIVAISVFVFEFDYPGKSLCTKATIQRVVDGDTIIVQTEDLSERKIRLLGINAPESVNPNTNLNTSQGQLSSDYLKSLLKKNDLVYLESDPSQQDVDKYNRLLRYVWVDEPSTNYENMINWKIVRNGYAKVNYYDNPKGIYYNALNNAYILYEMENLELINKENNF